MGNDDEMNRTAKKEASKLPVFRFVGPRLNMGQRTIVLGDAAHTVKPYYGLGCNTALEDGKILSNCLDESASYASSDSSAATVTESTGANNSVRKEITSDTVPKAVQLFSDRRSADTQALVTISRNMDRPGKLFFLNFILPLILDGMFHKLLPKVFGPNMFGMFQRTDIGFKQIQRKKRIDRFMQFTIIGTFLTVLGVVAKRAIQIILSRVLISTRSRVSVAIAVTAIVAAAGKVREIKKKKLSMETLSV